MADIPIEAHTLAAKPVTDNKPSAESEGWLARTAASAYKTGVELGENRWVQGGIVVGATALVVASRGKLAGLIEKAAPKVSGLLPEAERTAGLAAPLRRAWLPDLAVPQRYMRDAASLSASESLKFSRVVDASAASIESSAPKLGAPAIVQTDLSELPVLLRRRDQTVESLMKLHARPEWSKLSEVQSATRIAVEDSKAVMPPLPEGINPTRRVMEEYHGKVGTDWVDAHGKLLYREQVANFPETATKVLAPIVTDAFYGLSHDMGIPLGRFEVATPDGAIFAYGSAKMTTGAMKVAPEVVHGAFSFLSNVGTHEITHIEQDGLMISRLADKLGLGEKLSADEMKKLASLVKAEAGEEPTLSQLERVMKIRGGKPLTGGAVERADGLLQSHRTFAESWGAHSQTEAETWNLFKMQLSLDAQSARAVLNETITSAEHDPVYAELLKRRPIADLIATLPKNEYGRIDYLDRKASRALDERFGTILKEVFEESKAAQSEQQAAYRSWLHEDEAVKVGNYFEQRVGRLIGDRPILILKN